MEREISVINTEPRIALDAEMENNEKFRNLAFVLDILMQEKIFYLQNALCKTFHFFLL